MAKKPIDDNCFVELVNKICRETTCRKSRFETLYYSKGCFSGIQAARLLDCYKTVPEKNKVIKILEPRLCRMTCAEGREILTSFPICDHDRLFALNCIKRTLVDHHSTAGMEYILAAFEYERDKMQAMGILQTVTTYVADQLASGGHQGYAAMGGLYTQNWPLDEHLYGSIEEQLKRMPGKGEPCLHPAAEVGHKPSFYTSHPSYTYRMDASQSDQRGYPGARSFPDPACPTTGPQHEYYQMDQSAAFNTAMSGDKIPA